MFAHLNAIKADPILGLIEAYHHDNNPAKVDLGAGVYKTAQGNTPIMHAVQLAAQKLQASEVSKTYVGAKGCDRFNAAIASLVFGAEHKALSEQRIESLQTPGGCGGLRVAAELIKRANPSAIVWVSDPTWPNHIPLLSDAGLALKTYPYYNHASASIQFDDMLNALTQAKPGDCVLIHASCHNPTGADLSFSQWQTLTEVCIRQHLVPFIDCAYLGLGDGFDQDAQGLRYMTERVGEAIVVNSCSKNFGLYRERVGSLMLMGEEPVATQAAMSHAVNIARGIYSMPPNYGAGLVDIILHDLELTRVWLDELSSMRERMHILRVGFVDAMVACGHDRYAYIAQQKGMFSFLNIDVQAIEQLKTQSSIYMADSSRINVAGLSEDRLDYVASAIAKVI